jgi:hypothetical protein
VGVVSEDSNATDERLQEVIDQASRVVEFGHTTSHDHETVYLPLELESLGTQVWFSLVGPIIRAVDNGDTLLVDELDASLHPQLSSEVIRIFGDPTKNPKQAQILFTTHDTALLGTLLDERELRRDQVWFSEKKTDGSSIIYPLTDFSPRKTENLERGYLQGRYGAVPFLDEKILSHTLKQGSAAENHDDPLDESLESRAGRSNGS